MIYIEIVILSEGAHSLTVSAAVEGPAVCSVSQMLSWSPKHIRSNYQAG
jgi:hypothetical protein